MADTRIDLIPGNPGQTPDGHSAYILDSSLCTSSSDAPDQYDPSLGALASLNQALGLYFSGDASEAQVNYERELLAPPAPLDMQWAGFAARSINDLDNVLGSDLPEPVKLVPFSLEPNEPVVQTDDPHLVRIRYDRDELLERLLQRLYFKLIQGPVLLTVPYRGDAPSIPPEYRDWHNFRYGYNPNSNVWNDTRIVYVDWSLTQTVVLRYEDGKIACYDSGKKYYIDHTAAISAAAAMLAHPLFKQMAPDGAVDYLLAPIDQK